MARILLASELGSKLGHVGQLRPLARARARTRVVFAVREVAAALLACRRLDIFSVQYGMAFTVPPRVSPMPNFRAWEAVPAARLEASDAIVLDAANASLSQLRAPPLSSIVDLLDANTEFVCTFRELDHHRDRPATPKLRADVYRRHRVRSLVAAVEYSRVSGGRDTINADPRAHATHDAQRSIIKSGVVPPRRPLPRLKLGTVTRRDRHEVRFTFALAPGTSMTSGESLLR